MKRIDVVKKDNKWVGETKGGGVVAQGKTKDVAVKRTADVARKDAEAVSVKIQQAGRQDPRGAHIPAQR
jgi:hypothetical protein